MLGGCVCQVAVEVAGSFVGDFKSLNGSFLALPCGRCGCVVAAAGDGGGGHRRLLGEPGRQGCIVRDSGARVASLLVLRCSGIGCLRIIHGRIDFCSTNMTDCQYYICIYT